VNAINTTYDDAIKAGAMALFGEKYGDDVRMLEIGDFSRELCGGTHVRRTGEIGNFLIRSETAVGSGVRRIEALAGDAADLFVRDRLDLLSRLTDELGGQPLSRLRNMRDELNEMKRQLDRVQREQASSWVTELASQAESVDGLKVVAAKVDVGSFAEIRELGDLLRDRLGESVLVLASSVDSRPGFVGMVSPRVRLHAGRLVNSVASIAGGRGGGRPDVAQAGGGDLAKIDEALANVPRIVEEMLEREGRR
jgi:alanyl-tRNA synthetase